MKKHLPYLVASIIALCFISCNDDAPAIPQISIENSTVNEGRRAVFTVSLDQVSEQNITISIISKSQSAMANEDYSPIAFDLVIPAGTASHIVEVATFADSLSENDETFKLNLYNPQNAVITQGTAIGTIKNQNYYMEAMIDGQSWEAIIGGSKGVFFNTVQAQNHYLSGFGNLNQQSQISIGSWSGGFEQRSYTIQPALGISSEPNKVVIAYQETFGGPIYIAQEGTCSIEELDWEEGIAVGSFHFIAKSSGNDIIEVTDGRFSVPLKP